MNARKAAAALRITKSPNCVVCLQAIPVKGESWRFAKGGRRHTTCQPKPGMERGWKPCPNERCEDGYEPNTDRARGRERIQWDVCSDCEGEGAIRDENAVALPESTTASRKF